MALSRQPSDLKSRVITCLNKLSDRDTLSIASSELESIARSLSNDNFAPFLTCLSTTDSTEKSPVRRQCVRLITVLSAAHGDALSPHISKLLSAVLRRLRDPDSAVRMACVEAVSSISSHVNKPPFSSILKPLLDCIFHEQDHNAQIGASLCLAAAVEAAPEPEAVDLKKLLPRLFKLARNDCFKAKPALLSLIGSIVSTGAASSKNVLNSLVPCVVEFLSSEDWATRKAAAETLVKLATSERDLLAEHRSSCLASLENKKFDKVKVVRETMNRALEMWKEIPEASDSQLQSKSLSKDASSGKHSPIVFKSPCDSGYETPQSKKSVSVGSSPTSCTSSSSMSSSQRRGTLKSDNQKPKAARSFKVELKNSSDSKVEDVPQAASPEMGHEDGRKSPKILDSNSADIKNRCNLKLEAKCVLFPKSSDNKSRTFNNLRFRSRVVPLCEDDNVEVNVAEGDSNASEDYYGSQKEFEDFSLIRKQLIQIENQQSNLLELLQRFIGSSQRGMNSLEKRVNGLEKAIDEMSHDLVISTQRVSNTDSAGNTCCMLAGTEFLSPKFWRKTEGQNSNSKIAFSNYTMHNMPYKDCNSETNKLESPRNNQQLSSKSAKVPIGDANREGMETPRNNQQLSSKSAKVPIGDANTEGMETLDPHTDRRIYHKIQADGSSQFRNAGAVMVHH